MADRYTPLWIDPFENRLYAGFQNTQNAPTPVFKQGDKQDIELYLLKKSVSGNYQDFVPFPENCTIRLAIGKIDTAPTAGSFTISYGGDTTNAIAYDAGATDWETALNGLASVTTAGGVTVSQISSTTFQVSFDDVGVRTPITLNSAGLVPTCSSKVITARAGSVTASAIYIVKLFQSVVVFQDEWTDSTEPSISVTTLVANRSKRVTISPMPLSGTWTLTTTQNIQKKVDAAGGDETDVPTFWTETTSFRSGAFATTFVDADGYPIWEMDIINVGLNNWDFTVKNDYEIPVDYTMPFTVSGNFVRFPSKVASIDLGSIEVEYLLNGASSASAVLEIEIENEDGSKWTVLQTSCTIENDLIDQTSYTLSNYDSSVPEAPQDGNSYLRKDGAWVTDVDGGTY